MYKHMNLLWRRLDAPLEVARQRGPHLAHLVVRTVVPRLEMLRR